VKKVKPQTPEEIERAAWYARLAFGIYTEAVNAPPGPPERTTPGFNVMP
jgi:hypothetical protein